jgi:putative membrane protein
MNFTENDKRRIAEAVAAAESNTSGEIVPLVVDASDHYLHADLIGGLVGLIVFLMIGFWIFPEPGHFTLTLILFAGFAAGFILTRRTAALKRFIIGDKISQAEVHQRALQAFVEHNLMRTRDRTGILIMVSLLERRVQVLADEGINAKVPAGSWNVVVGLILDGVRRGSLIDGFAAGIARCGELLSKDFPRKPDDTNEIDDALLVE